MESARSIATIHPALTHLSGNNAKPQWQRWRQWLDANKAVLVAAAGVLAIVTVASLLASRYQAAAPITNNEQQDLSAFQSNTAQAQAGETAAPFAQLSQEQAQQTAQDQLGRFVELQLQLEQLFANTNWAIESVAEAKETALLGDNFFQRNNYLEAFSQYQRAADQLAATIEQGKTAVAAALEQTILAIDSQDLAASSKALAQAKAYSPNDPQIERLQSRINTLPQVSLLLREALNLELAERYSDALKKYTDVRALDPQTLVLEQRESRAQAGLKNQRIRDLLSKGFRALSDNKFAASRSAFEQVLKEQPSNIAAQGGIEQIGQLYDVAVIKQAESVAKKAMQTGDWNAAASAYQRILDLDANIQIGATGRAAALEHQRINRLLEAIRRQPERLSDLKLFNDAEIALAQATELPYQAPTLTALMENVRELLTSYRDPIDVAFLSDNAIEISLSNIGRLGRFTQRTLTLRPGVYTLRGSKDGCRDIYTNITVLPGMPAVEVFCTDTLPQP